MELSGFAHGAARVPVAARAARTIDEYCILEALVRWLEGCIFIVKVDEKIGKTDTKETRK